MSKVMYHEPRYFFERTEEMARLLAGYDDETWARLKADRKRTYRHAASTLIVGWDNIAAKFQEWKEEHEKKQSVQETAE